MDFIIAKGSVAYAAKTGGGVIAGFDEVDLLVDGAIAFIDQSGTLIDGNVPVVVGDMVTLAMGTSKGSVLSSPINKKTLGYTKTVYAVAAKKSMYIGNYTTGATYNLNMPTTIVKGDEAIVELTDLTKPYENTSRVVTITVVMKGGETATQVVTAVNAAINADYRAKKFVVSTIADADNGLKIEGLTVNNDFFVNAYGILANADILAYKNVVKAGTTGLSKGLVTGLTTPLPFNPGTGLATQMSKVENNASVYHGNLNSEMFESYLWSVPTGVVAGELYDQYYLKFTAPTVTPLIKEPNFDQHIVIAVPTSEYTVYNAVGPVTAESGAVVDAILAAMIA